MMSDRTRRLTATDLIALASAATIMARTMADKERES